MACPVICHFKGFRRVGPVDRFCSRWIDTAIGMTDEIGEHYRSRRIRARRFVTIYDGIDVARFASGGGPAVRRELGIPADAPLVVIVGHVQDWKGQLLVVEAVARARRRIPELHCLVVGGIHRLGAEYAERLKERVAAPDLAGHVFLTGARRDIAACMDATDVVVHASNREPFGRVLLEAMAASRAVIAPREGGPREIVVDGDTGVLVPPRDVGRARDGDRLAARGSSRRTAMARAARVPCRRGVRHQRQHARAVEAVLDDGRVRGGRHEQPAQGPRARQERLELPDRHPVARPPGIEVHIAWCPTIEVARRSRYVHAVHELPPFRPGDDAWKWAFLDLCERERFDLVIPTNDPTIIPLQEHRADLEPHARIYLLNERAYRVGYDKQRSYEVCREIGVPVPHHLVLPVPADPADVLREFSLPVVVKARSSFRSEDLGDRRRTRVARDADGLRQWLHILVGRADEVLIEEYFEGEGGGIDMLCADGEVLHAFQHLRLHEGRGYSSAPYRLSEPVHQGMLADARKFVRALDYTGVLMMEFRLNRDHRPVAVPRLQRPLLGGVAADGGLRRRLSLLALPGPGRREARLPRERTARASRAATGGSTCSG